jgi:hypothetical protein
MFFRRSGNSGWRHGPIYIFNYLQHRKFPKLHLLVTLRALFKRYSLILSKVSCSAGVVLRVPRRSLTFSAPSETLSSKVDANQDCFCFLILHHHHCYLLSLLLHDYHSSRLLYVFSTPFSRHPFLLFFSITISF